MLKHNLRVTRRVPFGRRFAGRVFGWLLGGRWRGIGRLRGRSWLYGDFDEERVAEVCVL